MKYLFFLLPVFFFNNLFGQLRTSVTWAEQSTFPPNEVIYYKPGKKLVWDDFQGSASGSAAVAALTYSGFGYNASIKTINGKGNLDISVYCYFSKPKSWVRQGRTTSYVLTHEQHHFDVSYISTVLFVDKLQSTKFTTGNYRELLARIYNECCDIMNKMQNDYDGQTKNGQVKPEQEKWNVLIDSRISSFTK